MKKQELSVTKTNVHVADENAVGSEDSFVDLSQMCQTELITSDPADPQPEINRLGNAGSKLKNKNAIC